MLHAQHVARDVLDALVMATTVTTRDGLMSDTRGAVMMTGLFLSFFLVGALWFVIGIGDSIVFRERMQEAADHSAFTSAALHAKGMNFIAAVNLIMLALVIVHIVLGLIHDITLVSCIVTGAGCVVWINARKVYTTYAGYLKPTIEGLNKLERAAAYGYPYVGLVKSVKVGERYGKQHRVGDVDVFAVSPSMVPDFVSRQSRVGLPVSPRPMKALCEKSAQWAYQTVLVDRGFDLEKAQSWLDKRLEDLGSLIGRGESDKDKELKKLVDLLKGAVPNRYCNDVATEDSTKTFRSRVKDANGEIDDQNEDTQKQFNENGNQGAAQLMEKLHLDGLPWDKIDPGFDPRWGHDGPMYVFDSEDARNGKFYMQVWSLNLRPKMKDPNETKVKMASRKSDGLVPEEGPFGYFAQAEFYFDCNDAWGTDACNGSDGWAANASYSLKWRARMRRVAVPDFGRMLGDYLFNLVTTSDPYEKVRNLITSDVLDKLNRGPFSGAIVEEIKTKVEEEVKKRETQAHDALVDGLQDGHDAVLDGVFH